MADNCMGLWAERYAATHVLEASCWQYISILLLALVIRTALSRGSRSTQSVPFVPVVLVTDVGRMVPELAGTSGETVGGATTDVAVPRGKDVAAGCSLPDELFAPPMFVPCMTSTRVARARVKQTRSAVVR